MKTRTQIKAGGVKHNHASTLKVKTKLRAGLRSFNHSQTVR